MEDYIESTEIILAGNKYTTYLKRVATRIENGVAAETHIKAFIKKII